MDVNANDSVSLFREPRIRRRTRSGSRISHSQTVSTFQPNAASASLCSRSRIRVRVSFGSQYSRFDFGRPAIGQSGSGCQCQKQPFTNITARWRDRVRSGTPGRSRRCSLKRNPARCIIDLTSLSGFISRDRIRDIHQERSVELRLSVTSPTPERPSLPYAGVARAGLPTKHPIAVHRHDDLDLSSSCERHSDRTDFDQNPSSHA